MDETHTTELGRLPHILLSTFIMGKLPTFFFFLEAEDKLPTANGILGQNFVFSLETD